eukprot:3939627-Rhodomonas_salina.1
MQGGLRRAGWLWSTLAVAVSCVLEVRGAESSEETDSDRYAWIHAVGNGGALLKSSDAGRIWAVENIGTVSDLMDVSFHARPFSRTSLVPSKCATTPSADGKI